MIIKQNTKQQDQTASQFLELLPVGIAAINSDYEIIYTNSAFCSFLDFQKSNEGWTVFDILPPHCHEVFNSAFEILSLGVQKSVERECTFFNKNGEVLAFSIKLSQAGIVVPNTVELILEPIQDKKTVQRLNNDLEKRISERTTALESTLQRLMQTDKELEESQQRYRLISEHSNDLVVLYDVNCVYKYVSPSILNFEMVPAEFVGRNFYEVNEMDTEFANLMKIQVFHPILQRKEKSVGPIIITRELFEIGKVHFELLAKPIFNEQDEITFILTAERDVTDRIEAKRKLRASEEKYRLISENMTDLITLNQVDGKTVYVSPSVKEMFGFEPDEIINQDSYNWFHPEDIERIQQESHYKILNGADSAKVSYRARHKDGHYIWVETITKAIRDEKGKLSALQTATRDITTTKQAQLELKKAFEKEKELNELKTQFVSMASHQFRTPLTVIRSNMELFDLLRVNFKDRINQKLSKISNRIQIEVEKLTEMMDDLLILGKIDAGKTPYHPSNMDLVEVAKSVVREDFVAETRAAQLNIKGQPYDVYMDDTLMRHVISNLLSNAYKYSKGKQSPEVTLFFEADEVKIWVKDFGIGIPKDELSNLFQPFYRAKNAMQIMGTGLGLVVVKEFVQLHQGKIWVESEFGKGSTFKIEMPNGLSEA